MLMKILFWLALCSTSYALALSNFDAASGNSFHVIDGDSISLQMRIYGIDTPEIGQKCQEKRIQDIDCGQRAKSALKNFLADIDGEITVKPVAFDQFDRLLVKLYYGDVDLAKLLVRSGIAFAYGRDYREDEQLAAQEKLGFWSYHQMPQKPSEWRKQRKR